MRVNFFFWFFRIVFVFFSFNVIGLFRILEDCKGKFFFIVLVIMGFCYVGFNENSNYYRVMICVIYSLEID